MKTRSATTNLRARLLSELDGTLPKPRGNALDTKTLESARPFAKACVLLARHGIVNDCEPIAAPSELLPPLP